MFLALLLQTTVPPATPSPSAGVHLGTEVWDTVKVCLPFLLFFMGRWLGKRDKAREKRDHEDADLAGTVKDLKRRADENDGKHTNFQQQIETVGNSARNAEQIAQQNKASIESLQGTLGRTEGQITTLITTLIQQR